MRKDIRVSFKDNPEEDKLYDDIMAECKLIGKSAWMKIAARDKLEKSASSGGVKSTIKKSNNQSNKIIESLDDLFG